MSTFFTDQRIVFYYTVRYSNRTTPTDLMSFWSVNVPRDINPMFGSERMSLGIIGWATSRNPVLFQPFIVRCINIRGGDQTLCMIPSTFGTAQDITLVDTANVQTLTFQIEDAVTGLSTSNADMSDLTLVLSIGFVPSN